MITFRRWQEGCLCFQSSSFKTGHIWVKFPRSFHLLGAAQSNFPSPYISRKTGQLGFGNQSHERTRSFPCPRLLFWEALGLEEEPCLEEVKARSAESAESAESGGVWTHPHPEIWMDHIGGLEVLDPSAPDLCCSLCGPIPI